MTMDDSGRATWTYRNGGVEPVVVTLEPEGEEIRVNPGSTLVVISSGGAQPRGGEDPIEVTAQGGGVTVWTQWPGSSVSVLLDGREV